MNKENINYIGCDYETCYFACVKGVSFSNIVVRGLRWSNMERPHANVIFLM
jgi:hypothetical protein